MARDGLLTALYVVFKYSVYALLTWNVWLYFQEDLAGSQHHFVAGVTLDNVFDAFAATIDTLSWLVLLLLFELETALLPDRWLRGPLRLLLATVRAVCYLAIVIAFSGYVGKLMLVTNLKPLAAGACSLLGTGALAVQSLDTYVVLDTARCSAMQGQALYQVIATDIVGTETDMGLLRSLALTDVINAGTWLVVVGVIELEVIAQHRRALTRSVLWRLQWFKALLYAVLLGCAIHWWQTGTFLDFWDAFLWLVAFVFIERNIFVWQAETAADAACRAGDGSGIVAPDTAR